MRYRVSRRIFYGAAALVLLFSSLSTGFTAQAASPIQEFTVPTQNAHPVDITEGADGALWFVQRNAQSIGRMTKTGEFSQFPIASDGAANISWPLIRGADDRLWLLDIRSNTDIKIKAVATNGSVSTYDIDTSAYNQVGMYEGLNRQPLLVMSKEVDGAITTEVRPISSNGTLLAPTITVDGTILTIGANRSTNTLWYLRTALSASGEEQDLIGKVTSSGAKTEYPSSFEFAVFLTEGPDGKMWFNDLTGKVVSISDNGALRTYTVGQVIQGISQIETGGNYMWLTLPSAIARINAAGEMQQYELPDGTGTPMFITKASDNAMWFTQPDNNQIGRIGIDAPNPNPDPDPDPELLDRDNDKLTEDKELQQNTSDLNWDTDGDGLSDRDESVWFDDRTAVFCNQAATVCEYPNPIKKDIYIEVDWMKKPPVLFGWGGYSMQPNDTQISAMKVAFQRQHINLHVDKGQLGGGNEVPYRQTINFQAKAGVVDFYDYKLGGEGVGAQFNQKRSQIYHYALMGHRYAESPTSTGVAYPGDDDLFVAYGVMKDYPSGSFDTSLAGTFMHELGHNLCLTGTATTAYPGQPSSCRHYAIDNARVFVNNYRSSMNYLYQRQLVDYSRGTNGSGDHDDWGTLRLADFALSQAGDQDNAALQGKSSFKFQQSRDTRKAIPGPTVK